MWCCFLLVLGNHLLIANSRLFADWNLDSFEFADTDLSDLNAKNMFLDDNSEANPTNDLFDNDSEFDTTAYSWNDVDLSAPNDDMYADFAIATDTPYDCPSPPRAMTRMYARSESCTNPDTSLGEPMQQRPAITTADQVEEYWCSASGEIGFGNIPVCDRSQRAIAPLVRPSELGLEADGIPPPSSRPLGFKNLGWCSLRKFMPETFGDSEICAIETLI